ncbi:MAG: hypothetical protein M3P33_01985 [bacterium]|nr:hypothetical protein [bacterium]
MSSEIISQIVCGGSKHERLAYIDSLILKIFGNIQNIKIIHIVPKDNSLGIEQIRGVVDSLGYTDLQFKTRAVIIENAEKMTHVAQNALLKIFEEPPLNTLLILEIESTESLLRTITSRGVVNQLNSNAMQFALVYPKFDEIRKMDLLDLFNLAEKYGNERDSSKIFINYLIYESRNFIMNLSDSNFRERAVWIPYMEFLMECFDTLTHTNVSSRFVIENCLLGFKNVTKEL